ncbi:hypothetical protein SD70_28655 [Gordoniibacillus kamchatkensis]|uniref:DUF177 domain-containing protein n=1 Tax=Gordoniibacillus kamchatkensis TaxID=1590651 RepID=A0ABR5ACI0_9BACL|nr:YceD family protein [Paenibacillus sp. VKM B-2647]KIL38097.1 hypothetical protein SD70_28655 [Paenibacillus sp. VKM B-2647]
MLLNMKEVATKEAAVRLQGRIDLSESLRARGDVVQAGAAEASLEAVPAGQAVVVHGTVSIEVEQRCARCLEPVKQQLRIPFQESFTISSEAAEKDDELNLVDEEKIVLDPYVEEAVQLGIPYIPLCKDECEGLCPVCGKNRNKEACDCKQEKIDPRLAGLADFFND